MFRDKVKHPLRLEGKYAILDEIAPKYFPYVIEWRNNPELNKYLNQPFVLTEELERKWYEDVYLKDDTGFMIVIDKETNTPIGTKGWANLDLVRRRCTSERLLNAKPEFHAYASFWESGIILSDYLFKYVDVIYSHIAVDNRRAIRLAKSGDTVENTGEIQYPENLLVNGLHQREYYCTREMYEVSKKKLLDKLDLLFG